jgi:hypothetical protein
MRCSSVVYVYKVDVCAVELTQEDERETVVAQFRQLFVIRTRARDNQAINPILKDKRDIGLRLADLFKWMQQKPKTMLLGNFREATYDVREESVTHNPVGALIEDQCKSVCLPCGEGTRGRVGTVSQVLGSLKHALPGLLRNLHVGNIVEDKGDRGTRDTSELGYIVARHSLSGHTIP